MGASAVIICSGGMDSVTLAHDVSMRLSEHGAAEPVLLSMDYGQRHVRELECARWQAATLGLTHIILPMREFSVAFGSSALIAQSGISVPTITDVLGDPQPPTYVPNRNMIFLSIAAAVAETVGADDVYYGAQRHDLYGYWDTTPEFLRAINSVLGLNRKNQIEIKAPYVTKSKADILRIGLALGVDYAHTWSCYQGADTGIACGVCSTCAERLKAWTDIGLPDPLPYSVV